MNRSVKSFCVHVFTNVKHLKQHKYYVNTSTLAYSTQANSTEGANKADANNTNKSDASQNEIKQNYYDIVISGGGMVGTAMASMLGKEEIFRKYKIALIESAKDKGPYKMPVIHSNRVSALSQSSVDFLDGIYNSNLLSNRLKNSFKFFNYY